MDAIKAVRKNIQYRLDSLVAEMIQEYALWGNKHLAVLLYTQAKGLHYALVIANGLCVGTLKLVYCIENEVQRLQTKNPTAYENFDARKFVDEMENLIDSIIDMD